MSDCVYRAWSQAAKDLGVRPRESSREFFELAKSLVGNSDGLWGGAAPVVVGLLCRMNNLTLSVRCHPWFNRTYYRAAAESQWQRWAVDLWGRRSFWNELAIHRTDSWVGGEGNIYLWLSGHHAYYALEPESGHLTIMAIKVFRQREVKS